MDATRPTLAPASAARADVMSGWQPVGHASQTAKITANRLCRHRAAQERRHSKSPHTHGRSLQLRQLPFFRTASRELPHLQRPDHLLIPAASGRATLTVAVLLLWRRRTC
eukprot:1635546-Prymnesium_polylepis.2